MDDRFIKAAKDGYVDILREATKRDLNKPDEDGMTATLWAAQSGNLEALRLIVGREGDVNKADYLGMTALHHAAMRGHMDIVSYLVHWGCNVHALDNDLHSAIDLAAMYDRHEIVRFLDSNLAEKQAKNPKQASRMKEEAIKTAEFNIKRYQKKTEDTIKIIEKEQKKRQLQMDQQLNQQNENTGGDNKTKPGFFKTLTLRIKGGPNSNSGKWDTFEKRQPSVYSDAAGMTYSGKRSGLNKKIQIRRLESLTPKPNSAVSEFKVSDLDDNGNRTIRSVKKGFVGSTSEVLYVTGNLGSEKGDMYSSKMIRAKSESELLDSGIDSNYGDENEENKSKGGMLNRPEFGTLTFLPKNPFLNTVHSFDDTLVPSTPHEINGDSRYIYEDFDEINSPEERKDPSQKQTLPWDQDDLSNLDDEEEHERNELSAVNMFLWTCGLASYLHIFAQEKIDMQVLIKMTDSELKELELPFGPRKKLQEAITRRKTVLETPTKMTDTHL